MMERIRNFLPDWGPVRWSAAGLALLIFIFSGVSVVHTPDYEVIYSHTLNTIPFSDGKTGVMLTLDLGNTGRKELPFVRVKFRNGAVDRAILPVTAKMFGVREIPARIERGAESTSYEIGPLASGKRVKFSTVLNYNPGEAPDPWDSISAGVETPEGKAREGDPAGTTFSRVLFSIFTCW